VNPLYDGELRETWMNGLSAMDKYNIKHILTIFALLNIPESYMDAGCGTGVMVRTARTLGVRAYGLDQLVEDSWGEGFYHVNLVDPFLLPEPVDIVTSFEVAEHLHESAHSTFCDTLCNNLKTGADHHLIFSAARPGQAGTGHVGCLPAEVWHNEFILRGLSYNAFLTLRLAHLFANIESPLNYMWDNLMCFSR
jgi:cyclopropane fatty-acyl-phospholipid synthase-like methyltransferase